MPSAWPASGQQTYRNEGLVPPRFTSSNLQGGRNPPRNSAESARGPWAQQSALSCLLQQIHLYEHILAVGSLWTRQPQKGKETVWKSSNTPRSSTCVPLERQRCMKGRWAAAAKEKGFCQVAEAPFQISTIEVAHRHRGDRKVGRSWMTVALMLWECLRGGGHHFAVCWVALRRVQSDFPKE